MDYTGRPLAAPPLRLLTAGLIGVVAWQLAVLLPQPITYQGVEVGDIGIPLLGFQHWLRGEPVYGLHLVDGAPVVNYPFTTMLLMAVFSPLPLQTVAPLFCALSSAALAYGLLQDGELWRLLVFLSFPFVSSLHSTQWAPWLMAALCVPGLLPLVVAKPQLGVVLVLLGKWRKSTLAMAGGLIGLSFALYPQWLWDWLHDPATWRYEGWLPLLTVPGFMLAWLVRFWRAPRARLLLVLALVPQRLWYDQLLVFLIPNGWQEMLVLTLGSWMAVLLSRTCGWITSFGPQDWRARIAVVVFLCLPALVMVLWSERARAPRITPQTNGSGMA